jgi:cellulose synthase/poly-beta-1,6-N-acetylglucosamine synthase-like glycosyltransferase
MATQEIKNNISNIFIYKIQNIWRHRRNNNKIYKIKSYKKGSDQGAGVIFRNKTFITHTKLSEKDSAILTFSRWQKIFIIFMLAVFIGGIITSPLTTVKILIGFLSTIYFIDVLFNLYVIFKSLYNPPELKINDDEIRSLENAGLPVYSILCPLYKEASVLDQFLDNINNIDWPKNKLDVLLLLEEDDLSTQEAINQKNLPKYVRKIVVPNSLPKTKPKACNYGLQLAKGKYLVIYDAEDKPDPLQLKKAYLAFQKVTPDTYCLQAKLNYYNSSQNLLTRLFTAEYSLWFDVVLPGLQSINTSIPLGGTSNHFRTQDLIKLHGWDPFNVTEDCDLGVRLFKAGYKTAIIDSTTLEEANSEINNWIRQRSRWIKGYFQTYFVHMRDPVNLFKEFKLHALVFQLVVGLRTTFILINPFLWLTTISYFVFYKYVGQTIESLYPPPIYYMAVFALVFGNFMYLYNYMIGCAKKEQWSLMKFIYLVPFYWFMMIFGAILAFYQLIFKPYFWEKTKHGLYVEEHKAKIKISINIEDFIQSQYQKIINLLNTRNETGFENTKSSNPTENFSINVLILNWYDAKHDWAGGAEIYINKIAKYLIKNGCKVTLFCGNDGSSLPYESNGGMEIIRKGSMYTVPIWAFLYYFFKFRGKYDIILDTAKGVPFFTPLYASEPVLGVIFHIHQEMFKMGLNFPIKQIAMFLEAKLMPQVYKNTEMITISDSSKKAMELLGLGIKKKINIAIPGVDIIPARTIKTEYPSMVYLGRLRDYKHVDIALMSFSIVKEKYPNAKFFIAGGGENENYLKRLCNYLNLNHNVEFKGRVSEEEKSILLSQSWVALQPSEIEGWGMTNIEANKCGTPVIASNVDGLKDSVIEGKTGILVPPRNIQALANAMDMVFSSESLRNYLSNNAIKWSKFFTWKKSGKVFLKVIRRNIRVPVGAYKYMDGEALEGVYD